MQTHRDRSFSSSVLFVSLLAVAITVIGVLGYVVHMRNRHARWNERFEGRESETAAKSTPVPSVAAAVTRTHVVPPMAPQSHGVSLPRRPSYDERMRDIAERARRYESYLASEARDSPWASQVEGHAKEIFADGAVPNTTLLSASCRSTMCRLDFEFATQADRDYQTSMLGRRFQGLPQIGFSYPGEPSDHTRAVAYLMREGSDLPPYRADQQLAAARN